MDLSEFGTTPGKQSYPLAAQPDRAEVMAKDNEPKTRLIQWTGCGPDKYVACERTWPILPGGVYHIEYIEGRLVYATQPLNIDHLFYFTDSIGDAVMQEIETFWNSADKYAARGFRHRRGYMLYGPQGSGKSSIVQQTIARITERGGIVILATCEPSLLTRALLNFRLVEPTRPVLCIFEDIDAIIQRHGDSDLLSLLDGECQIDYVLNLATTNYPENLDRRIVARPRRFDRIIKVDMPSADVRRAYFQAKLEGADIAEINVLVEMSKDLSFAALAEMIISVKCLGNNLEETVEMLREMNKKKPSSREFEQNTAGFGGNR